MLAFSEGYSYFVDAFIKLIYLSDFNDLRIARVWFMLFKYGRANKDNVRNTHIRLILIERALV